MSQSVTSADPAEPTVLLRADANGVVLQTDEANAMLQAVLDPVDVTESLEPQTVFQTVWFTAIQTRGTASSHRGKMYVAFFPVHLQIVAIVLSSISVGRNPILFYFYLKLKWSLR